MGRSFVRNFAREIRGADRNVRVGLALLLVGSTLQLSALVDAVRSRTFLPRTTAFLLVIPLVASYLYLFGVTKRTTAPRIEPHEFVPAFVRGCLLAAVLLPTLSEACIVSYLLSVVVDSGIVATVVLTGGTCVALMWRSRKTTPTPPTARELTLRGLVCLYVSALLSSIARRDGDDVLALAGPSLLAAGRFLLSNPRRRLPSLLGFFGVGRRRRGGGRETDGGGGNDDDDDDDDGPRKFEWLSRAARNALGSTLREAMSDMTQTFAEDEATQLAVLRWIADRCRRSRRGDDGGGNNEFDSPGDGSATTTTAFSCARRGDGGRRDDDGAGPNNDDGSSPPTAWDGDECDDLTKWEKMEPTTIDDRTGTSSDGDDGLRARRSAPPPDDDEDDDALRALRRTLASLDVDERCAPLVASIRRAVGRVPPSPRVATAVAVGRRCPSILVLCFRRLAGSPPDAILGTAVALLPMVVLEWRRAGGWAASCRRSRRRTREGGEDRDGTTRDRGVPSSSSSSSDASSRDGDGRYPSPAFLGFPEDVDPMVVLLGDDGHDDDDDGRPSSSFLLRAWSDVVASVAALETAVTAARCASTTAHAAELAVSVASLAELGVEVRGGGWLRGLTIVFREMLRFHSASMEPDAAANDPDAKYVRAAADAVRSGRAVARNVSVLAEEHGGLGRVAGRFLDAVGRAAGRGWLWGRDGADGDRPPENGAPESGEPPTTREDVAGGGSLSDRNNVLPEDLTEG